MRRVLALGGLIAGILLIASPAQAFATNQVLNPYLHTALDALTLAVVTAPLWTAYLWGPRRRGLLLSLVAMVQLPVAVIAFQPPASPLLHAALLVTALTLTCGSLAVVRRAARVTAAPRCPAPAADRLPLSASVVAGTTTDALTAVFSRRPRGFRPTVPRGRGRPVRSPARRCG